MRAALIACVLPLLVATEAAAEENCRNFSWSVGRPIDLFDEPLPVVENAQSLPKEGVFALVLRPVADVIYLKTPERGSDGSWGGVITLENHTIVGGLGSLVAEILSEEGLGIRLKRLGLNVHLPDVLADIHARDERDTGRGAAPLRMADDATLIDTSEMSVEQAIATAIEAAEARR